jgi:hypothetical protein
VPGIGFDALCADERAVGAAHIHYLQTLFASTYLSVVTRGAWVAEDYIVVGLSANPDWGL